MPPPLPPPPIPVESLIAPMSPAVVLAVIVNALVSMSVRADLWPQEGVLLSCMTVVATVISGAINSSIGMVRAGWLPTAVGGWLTWLALYFYGVARIGASFATGTITLTNGGAGLFAFAPYTAIFQNPTTGKTYTNTIPIALAPGPGTSQPVTVQATEIGTASNAQPGEITKIVTTMIQVTASNAAAVVGTDAQLDASLKLECWNAIAANSPFGPRQSFAYAIQNALNAISGTPVNVNRWSLSRPDSAAAHKGQVVIYVASPAGAADPDDVQGVWNSIDAIARPECVTHYVYSATPATCAGALTVYVTATPGLAAATVQAKVAADLVAFFASPEGNPIGGRTVGGFTGLFATSVSGVCRDAWPPRPSDPTLPWASAVYAVTGATDLPLTESQVAVDALTVVVSLV